MTHFVVSCDAHPFDWCAPMARVKTALQHVFVILIEVHLDAEHAVRCGVDCRRAIKILPPRGVRKVFDVSPGVSACGFAKCPDHDAFEIELRQTVFVAKIREVLCVNVQVLHRHSCHTCRP